MKNSWNFVRKTIAALCLIALFSQQVMAQSESGDDEWNHSLAVYLWGASISGTTASGTGLEVDFKDIADNLEFGAMAAYQARKGKWSILTDVIYLDVSANNQLDLLPPIGGDIIDVTTTASLDLTAWVIHLGGGYNLYNDGEGTTTDFVFGARYLDLESDLMLNFNITPPDLDYTLPPLSASEDFWDAIIGFRGAISLGDRWFMPWGANIGAGDSDLSWQAMAGVAFKASSWADIVLTYRYLKWEFDDAMVEDLSLSGPLLGVVFRF